MTVARIFKRCPCPEEAWKACPHQWVVRYRTAGGRSSRQHEQSFGTDLREAEDFALKVEHDKRAHVFVDPKAGQALFRVEAATWLDHHLGADSSIATYWSVLRAHIDPAIGGKPIGAIRREDIKALIATMHRKGLSASRIGCAHLVISAVLAEAVRDKKLPESPCSSIQLPGVVTAADFVVPVPGPRPSTNGPHDHQRSAAKPQVKGHDEDMEPYKPLGRVFERHRLLR